MVEIQNTTIVESMTIEGGYPPVTSMVATSSLGSKRVLIHILILISISPVLQS
jgi:hypothetical protein